MPTALKEAVAHGSADITAFVTQHCNEATDRVSIIFSHTKMHCHYSTTTQLYVQVYTL